MVLVGHLQLSTKAWDLGSGVTTQNAGPVSNLHPKAPTSFMGMLRAHRPPYRVMPPLGRAPHAGRDGQHLRLSSCPAGSACSPPAQEPEA